MNMLMDNIKHMLHCGYVVLGIVSVACCQQEINVAILVNGGQCYSSMFPNSWANCNRLIDGVLSGPSSTLWDTATNITDQSIHFEFDRPYAIRRVVVYHPYSLDQRNINKVALQFASDSIYELTLSNNVEGRGATDAKEIPGIKASRMIMTFINIDMMENPYYALQEVEVYGINFMDTTTPPRTTHSTTTPTSSPSIHTSSTTLASSISFLSKVTSSSIPSMGTNENPSTTEYDTDDFRQSTADAKFKNEIELTCGGSDSLTIGVTVALLCVSTIVAHIIIVIVLKKCKERNTNERGYESQFLNTISGNGSSGTSNINMEYEDVSNLPLPSIVVTNNQPTHPRSVKNPIDVNTNAKYEELGMVSGPRPEPQYDALKSYGNI